MSLVDLLGSGFNKLEDSARRQAGKHIACYDELAFVALCGRLLSRKDHSERKEHKTNCQKRIIVSSLHWSTSSELILYEAAMLTAARRREPYWLRGTVPPDTTYDREHSVQIR